MRVLCDQDLYQRCEKMRPTLFRLASDTEDNDEALGEHDLYTSAVQYQYLLQVFSSLWGLQQDTELSLPCSFKVMTDKKHQRHAHSINTENTGANHWKLMPTGVKSLLQQSTIAEVHYRSLFTPNILNILSIDPLFQLKRCLHMTLFVVLWSASL